MTEYVLYFSDGFQADILQANEFRVKVILHI
jgi:hypothetical protein